MNVLAVGGTGFVGTALCRELLANDHEVAALSRTPEEADLPSEVELLTGDVREYQSIEPAFAGRDAVVFLPALSPLFKPSGGDEMHFEVHLQGTRNAVRAAEEHDVERFLQLSALGADASGETAYIRAKGQAERVVRDATVTETIIRPSVVFGDGGEFLRFTKLLAPPYLTALPGGGKTRFQPIWLGDLVPMLVESIAAEESSSSEAHAGEAYDIGGPEVLTLAEIARLAHGAENKPVNVYNIPMPLAGLGLKLMDRIPGAPMGVDQYRSLQFDNTTVENDIEAFGLEPAELRTLASYLDVDPAVATRTARA